MVNSAFADNIIQLAALASIIDGQASEQEQNLIVDICSHELRISPEEVRSKLDNFLGVYQIKKVANTIPAGEALYSAKQALNSLPRHDKFLAFYICEVVIYQDEIQAGESDFIRELESTLYGDSLFTFMFMDGKIRNIDNIIQLAALASIIDGQASEQEKNVIVDICSHELRISPDEVRSKLDNFLGVYQIKKVANTIPAGEALSSAKQALNNIPHYDRLLAFYICEAVIYQDGIQAGERDFIRQLESIALS